MRAFVKRIILVGMLIDVLIVAVLFVLKRRRPSKGDEQSDEIALTTIFEGRELKSRATAFRGGSILTAAGGTLLDLRSARLAPEGAVLRVRSCMGGTMIVVHESWSVEVRGRALVGGIADRTRSPGEASPGVERPHLIIEAFALFGGIDVGYRRRRVIDQAKSALDAMDAEPGARGGTTAEVPI